MRGTRELRREGGKIITGIIPAYAGNTGGEGAGHGHASGSSPRMRGTHLVVREVVLMAGIIPAYAGNTWSWWCSASIPWDHPRVCGEHLGCLVGRVDGGGIIPAYAGNTSGMRLAHSHWRDHPRVCGEHKIKNATALAKGDHPRVCGEHYDPARPRQAAAGSSPRMRGTP